MELGVVGTELFNLGFRLLGVRHVFDVTDEVTPQAAVEAALEQKEVGVLVIHDDEWGQLPDSLRTSLSNSVHPTVIAIGAQMDETLRDRIRTAVGVDLWK